MKRISIRRKLLRDLKKARYFRPLVGRISKDMKKPRNNTFMLLETSGTKRIRSKMLIRNT